MVGISAVEKDKLEVNRTLNIRMDNTTEDCHEIK